MSPSSPSSVAPGAPAESPPTEPSFPEQSAPAAAGGATSETGGRLVSLDVLRGFDMFWILGMEEVAMALGNATDAPWARFLAHQLEHASWEGFRFLDLIFPLFVFISGVSLVYSAGKSLALRGKAATARKLAVRALVLYLLGLFCYGGLSKGVDEIRWLGVLQRIAICGLAGGLAYLYLGRKARVWLTAGLLIGYWLLMSFTPVPGFGAGDFTEGRNLANWIDAKFLPGFKWDGDHDPEGLLSTLPAIATALLGVFTGEYLRQGGGSVWRKARTLAAAGVVLTALGWAWSLHFPVIKKLWTSSYVLVAAGYSLLLLSLALAATDGWKARRGLAPFVWIGMNPIALYLSHHVVNYGKISESLLGGPVAGAFGQWGGVVVALGVVGLSLLLAWFLYSRKIFLRV